jgi:general secretion pathway protein M
MSLALIPKLSLDSLSERELRIVQIGAIVGVALLVFGVIVPLESSVSHAHKRIGQKQADLAWMRTVAPEIAAAGPPPSARGESLLVIVDRSARESGLGSALAGSEPAGPDALSVRLEKAPFDTLVGWLVRLSQQNGIRVDSASIDTAGEPGVVNAAVVLHAG